MRPLQAIVHGGSGPPSVVFLHGYGSRAEDWLQFEPKLSLPGNTQLIYPQAPLRGPDLGPARLVVAEPQRTCPCR